jgi:hypothetical protein
LLKWPLYFKARVYILENTPSPLGKRGKLRTKGDMGKKKEKRKKEKEKIRSKRVK